jgi:CubicO group peptidase (beta-lactamase class C family)
MGHTAGIRHNESEADYMPTAHCERAADGVKSIADDPLRFQPETASAYSTFGWILVSAAIEAAANEPFFAFMRGRIFGPLGMRDTTSDPVAKDTAEVARRPTSCGSGIALNGGGLLEPATVSLLQEPQADGSRTVLGGSSSFMTFPERGIVVAVMSNTSSATLWPIALHVAEMFGEGRGSP